MHTILNFAKSCIVADAKPINTMLSAATLAIGHLFGPRTKDIVGNKYRFYYLRIRNAPA
jgi:hypothetical protein